MEVNNIFNVKKVLTRKVFFYGSLFCLVSFILYEFNIKNEISIIDEFTDNYYKIPIDKEGKKIPNLNKKVLHLNLNNEKFYTNNDNLINYSIQLYSSINYEETKQKLNYFLKKNIFNQNDFFILSFDHSLGKEYLLTYKNFKNKDSAFDFCSNYLNFINKCLIVNVQNLN